MTLRKPQDNLKLKEEALDALCGELALEEAIDMSSEGLRDDDYKAN
jgi:hypothetical protein